MLTNQTAVDIDDLLLELDHKLIDLRYALGKRYEQENLPAIRAALIATQASFNAACSLLEAYQQAEVTDE